MERKFQVGDIAKVVATAVIHEFIIGEIVEIIELAGVHGRYLAQSTVNRARWYVDEEHIKLVSGIQEEKKFQVGDKAKIIHKTSGHYFNIGDVVDVMESVIPEITYHCTKEREHWYVNIHDMELVEKEEKTESEKENNQSQPLPATILDKAKELVYGDRERDYGSASKNFENISKMWSVILDKEVSIEEVIQCMIALKQCRLINQPTHFDSWVDIAGYVGCWDKTQKGL